MLGKDVTVSPTSKELSFKLYSVDGTSPAVLLWLEGPSHAQPLEIKGIPPGNESLSRHAGREKQHVNAVVTNRLTALRTPQGVPALLTGTQAGTGSLLKDDWQNQSSFAMKKPQFVVSMWLQIPYGLKFTDVFSNQTQSVLHM